MAGAAKPKTAKPKTAKPKTAKPKETQNDEPQALVRRFKENTQYFSDLFKLQVGRALQYVGFRKESKEQAYDEHGNLHPDWLTKEHTHFYRTVDSKGVAQEYCTPACGHTHKMKVTRNAQGEIVSAECVSGPVTLQVTKKGPKKRVYAPINEFDDHTHEVTYERSDKLASPKINVEAAKVISREASKLSKEVHDNDGNKLGNLAVQ